MAEALLRMAERVARLGAWLVELPGFTSAWVDDAALGLKFNQQFTDDNAACMVFSEDAYAMLLQEPYFKTFTRRPIVDAHQQTEGIFALSCVSRAEVDEILKKALAAARRPRCPPGSRVMYRNSFYDLDGHHWEVLWMDPGFVQK